MTECPHTKEFLDSLTERLREADDVPPLDRVFADAQWRLIASILGARAGDLPDRIDEGT